ncbi:MAG: DUF6841 family protein [Casimicrobium sp.]
MSSAEVQQFFEAYRDRFNRLDADAVADVWHVQSGITHPAQDGDFAAYTMWSTDAPMRANMHALCNVYRNNDYSHAEFEINRCESMGAHHAFAVVAWTLFRNDGSELQSFKTGYNLMRTENGPRVMLATQFEEDINKMKRDAAH